MIFTQKLAVAGAVVAGLSLTAGLTDMMVAHADNPRAETAASQQSAPSYNSPYSCVQDGKRWAEISVVNGNVVTWDVFRAQAACDKRAETDTGTDNGR